MGNFNFYGFNAIIAENSDILPASAYYAATAQINNGGWNLSNLGLTHFHVVTFSPPVGFTPFPAQVFINCGLYSSVPFDFSGNKLPVADVDGLFASAANAVFSALANIAGSSGGFIVIDTSGGTNAAPTPSQAHVDAIYTLTFNHGSVCIGGFTVFKNSVSTDFTFDPLTNFSGSSGLNIGTMDDPTGSQIATYVGGFMSGLSPVVVGADITLTNPYEPDYSSQPGSLFDLSPAISGVTGNQTQTGVSFIRNANVTYLIGQGATITTN